MNKTSDLSVYQWLLLSKILQQNSSVKDALELLDKMIHKKRIEEIQNELKKGTPLGKILNKNTFEKQVGFYCQFTSLQQAISISYSNEKNRKEMMKQLSSKISYSVILFVSSLVVLMVFTDYVLPMMMDSLSFDQQSSSIVLMFRMINVFKNMFLIILLVIVIGTIYVIVNKKQTIIWAFLHKYHRDSMIKTLATYQMVMDLSILLKNNCSLIQSLEIIRFNPKRLLASMLASHFHDSLIQGIDFENSLDNEYFDEGFHAICLWGLREDDFIGSLEDYKQIIDTRTIEQIQQTSTIIQTFCYVFVVLIIVLAYQVLLLPLEMLETL